MSQIRQCTVCGSVVAFSHREYSGKGMERAIWLCTGCGAIERSEARPRSEKVPERKSRKRPVNEGPPENPVIDSATAEALKRMFDADG